MNRFVRYEKCLDNVKLGWVVFFLIVLFQIGYAVLYEYYDGDDAYYGAQAVAAQQLDTLYRVNPYTGRSTPLDIRHGLGSFSHMGRRIWEE